MKTRHEVIWNNATLQEATAPLSLPVFGNSVCGVRIQNRSVWVLMVTETATGAPVEELPPFSWVLIPNPVDYTFQLLVANNNLTKPADMRVSVTYVDTPVTYAYGTISPLSGQSLPISGIDSANNGVLVGNDTSSPVNNNPVQGSPVVSSGILLTSGSNTSMFVTGGVLQKLFVYVTSTTSTAPGDTSALLIYINGKILDAILLATMTGNTGANWIINRQYDLSPGINANGAGLQFLADNLASGSQLYGNAFGII